MSGWKISQYFPCHFDIICQYWNFFELVYIMVLQSKAITWTNYGSLPTVLLGTNFSKIWTKMPNVSFKNRFVTVCGEAILFKPQYVNSSYAGTRLFLDNWLNTMAADALSPCVTRTSTPMVLNCRLNRSFPSSGKDFKHLCFSVLRNDRKWKILYFNNIIVAAPGLSHPL